jgi:hypothetical protein
MPDEAIAAYRSRTRTWTGPLSGLRVTSPADQRRDENQAAVLESFPELDRRRAILQRYPKLVA